MKWWPYSNENKWQIELQLLQFSRDLIYFLIPPLHYFAALYLYDLMFMYTFLTYFAF